MRRRRRIGLVDVPRLLIRVILELAGLFGGRYRRTEGAHVLVTDASGRILAVRTTYLGPGWMLPGGRVERTETPHRAAVRETREETGLEVTVDRLLLIDAHRRGNVSFVFAGRLVGGDLSPQFGEIAEVGWLDRDEIAATSWRLDRLLSRVDELGEGIAYWGLESDRERS
ncbi:MAG TPA: NUDIX domain-containing protein [Patescibacteria group bacterium]|nr:NUDIX domain-containing protein [Patescibacteria group bacterium]